MKSVFNGLLIFVIAATFVLVINVVYNITNMQREIDDIKINIGAVHSEVQNRLVVYNLPGTLNTNKKELFGQTVVFIHNSMCNSCVEECILNLNSFCKKNEKKDYKIVMDSICMERYKYLDFFQPQLNNVVVVKRMKSSLIKLSRPFIVLFDKQGYCRFLREFDTISQIEL